LVREVTRRGLVASISGCTLWHWLDEDAIRPWQHPSWIFPRDPDFQVKAERVLDLYQGLWEQQALGADDYIISADEKTSIQARLMADRLTSSGNVCFMYLLWGICGESQPLFNFSS
jgi:hypothetical protein